MKRTTHGGLGSGLLVYPFTLKEKQQLLKTDESESEFMHTYALLEPDLQSANDIDIVRFRNMADSHRQACDVFINRANGLLGLIDQLSLGFESVKTQTLSFQQSCDTLSTEQARLQSVADELEAHLKPFNMLEEFTRRLNMPGTEFVTQEGFRHMLASLDDCLDYVTAHASFAGADQYQVRFRQCMTRALTLIRGYFVQAMRDVAADVQQHIQAKALNDATQSALFYTKFKVDAPLLKQLTSEIEQRRKGHEEYASLIGDCYKCYTNVRRRLILPVVIKRVNEMKNSIPDLLQLTRQSVAYMRTVCNDEYDLFYAIFISGEDVVYDLLDSACEPLQDGLRNRIIHEKKAEVLYELCSLLQALSQDDEFEEYYDRPRLDFGRLFQSTLQDAQVKLAFRMQAYS
ncbi:Sec34-like family-domain-containing protein [Lipomyces japonicus]|uniref:Sec34-like family-domain-containing protein n=1 Tax=Lipomyces japonicus TaxID=56871 RepID=UPI0034CD401C